MITPIVYHYFIRSGWPERTETPAVIGAKFLQTLDALSGIDPIFANWEIFDCRNRTSLSLAAARSRIANVIENNIARGDFDEPLPIYGYWASAMAGEFRDPRSAHFRATAGGRYECGTKLEFGEYDVVPDLTIVTYPLFRAALLAINAIWRAPWACAQAFRSGAVAVPMDFGGVQGSRIDSVTQVPLDPTFPRTIFHIPWIAYLSAERAAGLKLTPQILTERMPDGGLLMSATTERLDPTNPEHVRRARILAETLIACGGETS
jgi:hypothetical protein